MTGAVFRFESRSRPSAVPTPTPVADQTDAPFDAVLLVRPEAESRVGGLRLVERAALTLARAGARRLLFVGPRIAARDLPAVPITWIDARDRSGLAAWADDAGTVVVLDATAVADTATIVALATADGSGTIAVDGAVMLWRCPAAALPRLTNPNGEGRPEPASGWTTADAPRWRPPPGALLAPAGDPAARRAAERLLYSRLGRPGDGWFTRVVDRRISRVLTRLLVPTGITPNQITLASTAIGVAAGVLFATGGHEAAIAGALLFLFSTIVDGCDGELARLMFRESALGARLDIIGDNVVHLALFGGIAIGLNRRGADAHVAVLGAALVTGVVLAMAAVYLMFFRREPTLAQRALFDAVASREFAYLLVAITVADKLEWFLWLAALGTYAFVAALFLISRPPSHSGSPGA